MRAFKIACASVALASITTITMTMVANAETCRTIYSGTWCWG